jgi:preprotein translocase subunit SecE
LQGKAENAGAVWPGELENFFVNNWIQIVVVAAVILAVFGVLWWQGQVQRLAVYVTETREELKKCAWQTWDELKGSTALISIMIALLGGFVVVIDLILTEMFFHRH